MAHSPAGVRRAPGQWLIRTDFADLRERIGVPSFTLHRDVHSAEASGAAGTPTMFVNGRRHQGAHDFDTPSAAIERDLAAGL